MTTQIERAPLAATKRRTLPQTISSERFRAPFSLRCGALLIDYILFVGVIVLSTLAARLLGGARLVGDSMEMVGIVAALGLAVFDLVVLTALSGRSFGKWATGLRIERIDGQPLGFGRAILRHFIGYPLSLLVFGFGFLMAAFNARGRALHDMIAGTIVIRDEARHTAQFSRPAKPSLK